MYFRVFPGATAGSDGIVDSPVAVYGNSGPRVRDVLFCTEGGAWWENPTPFFGLEDRGNKQYTNHALIFLVLVVPSENAVLDVLLNPVRVEPNQACLDDTHDLKLPVAVVPKVLWILRL